jgi:pathogenesis-related protein 1
MFEPRAAATPVAPPSSPQRPSRALLRAALGVLPWLLLGVACLDENSSPDDGSSEAGSDVVGQSPNVGASGSAATGAGGTTGMAAMTPAGGFGGSSPTTSSGGMSSLGGGGQSGAGGLMGPFPAEPGETGIFIGMTAAHNAARAELSTEKNLNPPLGDLTWSQDLADFAQEWADTLANATNCGGIFHRDQRMYGENIAWRGSNPLRSEYAPEAAVAGWVAEVACWKYGAILGNGTPTARSESCDATCIDEQNSSGCGHYTQVIWRNTKEVGCGYAQCLDKRGLTDEIWVCNYDPPGNFVGQTPY